MGVFTPIDTCVTVKRDGDLEMIIVKGCPGVSEIIHFPIEEIEYIVMSDGTVIKYTQSEDLTKALSLIEDGSALEKIEGGNFYFKEELVNWINFGKMEWL